MAEKNENEPITKETVSVEDSAGGMTTYGHGTSRAITDGIVSHNAAQSAFYRRGFPGNEKLITSRG